MPLRIVRETVTPQVSRGQYGFTAAIKNHGERPNNAHFKQQKLSSGCFHRGEKKNHRKKDNFWTCGSFCVEYAKLNGKKKLHSKLQCDKILTPFSIKTMCSLTGSKLY